MYPNRKGLFGSAPMPSGPAMPDMTQPQTKPREGPSRLQRGLGIAGDIFLGLAGQPGVFGPMQMQRQLLEQQQGYRTQQGKIQREQDQQDWLARQEYERANQAPDVPTPGSFEWYQTATPEARAQYDEYNPVTVATGAGPVRVPRNRPALGFTRPIAGAPAPTRQNTPAPTLGANGLPSEVTRQQYQALVNESDGNTAAVNDYLARMGIQVRN
jgi:hypothetical protein